MWHPVGRYEMFYWKLSNKFVFIKMAASMLAAKHIRLWHIIFTSHFGSRFFFTVPQYAD
jgi:hypothetical protein